MTQATWKNHFETLRRYLVVLFISVWFGGFTFYSVVVIHVGHRVFESKLETGFLTQQVTNWLNLIGVGALLVLLWDLMVLWGNQKNSIRWSLLIAWIGMAGLEIWLFLLHPVLDRTLDSDQHTFLDRPHFLNAHVLYVSLSTAQWAAMLVYLWANLAAWRARDAAH